MRVRRIWAKGHCNKKPKKPCQSCACGCGQVTSPGKKWISGHNSKTKDAKEKKSKMFDRLWKDGKFEDRHVWNEGLTVKTSEKLAAVGRKISESYTRERKSACREMMLGSPERWPPQLSGKDHPNWKGGITDTQHLLRGSYDLWKRWKLPILARDDFSCVSCSSKRELVVHHNGETMSEILRRFFYGVTEWDDKKSIVDSVVNYHVEHHVSGITLCKTCHNFLHWGSSHEE